MFKKKMNLDKDLTLFIYIKWITELNIKCNRTSLK